MVVTTTEKTLITQGKEYDIPTLPLDIDIENKVVLKKTRDARAALAELKGVTGIMPNQNILISTLSLQEAKDSSAIENIITTHDALYKSDALSRKFTNAASKEVHNYAASLRWGYREVQRTGLLTNNHIKKIQTDLEENDAGFRSQSGTVLKNEQTEEIIYTPPQELHKIEMHMQDLERFINDDKLCDWDPLVKMAVIHHQFESIHPFFDGNGRTGRIINILYLVKIGLLDTPILYLSRFINQNKADYYRQLQAVRENTSDGKAWEEWVLFMLEGIEQTSRQTIILIQGIKESMQQVKHQMREEFPKIYSQDLLNNLFRHPYTKIDFVEKELGIHKNTARKYLEALVPNILDKHKIGRENFYLNRVLFDLLLNAGQNSNNTIK